MAGSDRRGERSDVEALEVALAKCQELQDLATTYGIGDIFQDNGGKVLQTLIILGLRNIPGREGNDAQDAEGFEYELKTVNVSLGKNRGITTHHHLNAIILAKYRSVRAWYISLYENIKLITIYRLTPVAMEPLFQEWEQRIAQRIREGRSADLNNPKIPMHFVREHGTIVYPVQTREQAAQLPPSSPYHPEDERV